MSNIKNRDAFYNNFFDSIEKNSLIDFLNNSACDEIVLVDLNKDTFEEVFLVENKYFCKEIETNSYRDLFYNNYVDIVHPDDVNNLIDLLEPETMLEKLKHSRTPNFRHNHVRYKLKDGSYRWIEQCAITGLENGLEEGIVKLFFFFIAYLYYYKNYNIEKEIT